MPAAKISAGSQGQTTVEYILLVVIVAASVVIMKRALVDGTVKKVLPQWSQSVQGEASQGGKAISEYYRKDAEVIQQ